MAERFQRDLKLECLIPSSRAEWDVRSGDLNRPGMQFCGFYEYFAYERPQVIGKVEMTYLEQRTHEERVGILEKYCSYPLPCIIICRGMTPPDELLAIAKEHDIPVYRSAMVTTRFSAAAITYLAQELAPHIVRHGVLLDVYGIGVLLTGRSGVGKSEAALELIKRGHQLVADDRLIGSCPETVRYLMEIRGIGLIDIKAMFGISAVSESKTIDLVLELEKWDENQMYDRLVSNDFTEILDVLVPHQKIPVRPGRNLAIIVEVAARNLNLKRMGYQAVDVLQQRLGTD